MGPDTAISARRILHTMPLEKGCDQELHGQEGDFPGEEAARTRIDAMLTSLDSDGDGTLTMEELCQLLPEDEAKDVAGMSKEDLASMMMGFFGNEEAWLEAGPKLMAIEKYLTLGRLRRW